MSEFQKIAVGLLGMSHPEIYRFRALSSESAPSTVEPSKMKRYGSEPTPAATALRGVKFALAALLAGARSVPLGDNGRITRELGEYGAHLKGC
ncbi:MAG TPA: hypothetical protein VK743_04765 [Steroidobacteraceae bacterium]|jgi:hypothetical protein|nr:hypothetical protein [Steroidobacteraceae bacterium]